MSLDITGVLKIVILIVQYNYNDDVFDVLNGDYSKNDDSNAGQSIFVETWKEEILGLFHRSDILCDLVHLISTAP